MRPDVLTRLEEEGHYVFEAGAYNLNIIGVRTPPGEVNTFDDELHVVYRDERGKWIDLCFPCTTDPGLYWLKNPIRRAGTAILKPGQYRGSHKIGLHRGRYTALVQRKPVTVYRDRNRNAVLDMDQNTEQEGIYGINIHHAGHDSHRVDKWSAGCTVIANLNDWEIFMAVVRRAAEIWGDRFTYTLVDSVCAGCGCTPCDCLDQ
ncbi:MAG: hypothetical protein Unbinned4944contig1000_25 [Prokaryotic dsDNA virus sp.]|nr:MAG: hypothetical protein Unbinned4944contig1000_25 [Prokaryotic dsDNA virus sp.]|tara:strand:+ start:643 stop:1254 length:612 start_codon:yes stop_codon:yes gene_type:complete